MIELFLLLVSAFLIIGCGIFVAAEFALIAANRQTIERQAASGDIRAKGVAKALSSLSTQLSSAQVGITVTNLAIGFLTEPAIAKLLEQPLTSIGVPSAAVPGIALVLGISLATVLTMIFGELIPKNLAIARPLATAKAIQGPLLLFSAIMKYPIQALNHSANLILRRFGVEPQEELASARSADELLSLVRRSAAQGTLAKETTQLLERSLNFGDLTALDVMTPRVAVKAIQEDQPIKEVVRLAKETGFSRFPVYGTTIDNVVGIVQIKHVLGIARSERGSIATKQVMRAAVLVPSSIELEALLEALRKGGSQIAVLIDEFGGTDGIVTIEDLLEELVGEVQDEHDTSAADIHKQPDGSLQLSALLRPDEIGEELDIYLPEEEKIETLGGLISHHLERIPSVGDEIIVKAVDRNGSDLHVVLTVTKMDANRIDRVKLLASPVVEAKDDQQ